MSQAAENPAAIEARIHRRRESLRGTLEEIGVRVHPRTIVGDAKARAAASVDRTVGGFREKLTHPDGSPRMSRVVPIALAVVAVGLMIATSRSAPGGKDPRNR
ncbi:DUF3618 domain-containing protein [Streptomyces sp. NPDC059853]|uniref:DUF3618 domain-containing protein n=1 Tax=Streptomyces sp. NPDC059853 TaxID=3346973 RepID=UPI00364DA159